MLWLDHMSLLHWTMCRIFISPRGHFLFDHERLTGALEAITNLVIIVQDMASPQAPDHGGVVVVPRPRADMGISLLLEAAVADTDRSLKMPWAGPCCPNILGGLVSLRDDFFMSSLS
jgi:hypothetical protein